MMDHIEAAEEWLDSSGSLDPSLDAQLRVAQVHATLAVAKELRTANAIALATNYDVDWPTYDELVAMVHPRAQDGIAG